MTKIRAAVSACLAAVIACAAQAQEYPARAGARDRAFAAGGPNDIIVRLVAQKLAASLGQPFPSSRTARARAATSAPDYVAKSAPDGLHAALRGARQPHHQPLDGQGAVRHERDFAPIALMARAPNALVAHPSLAAHSVKELIALARARPGAINYGSGGNGSTPHLAAALFAAMAGVELTHVPYKGTAPATADLIGGQVQIAFLGIPAVLPHARSGKAAGFSAVTGCSFGRVARRVDRRRIGVPGYEGESWYGLLAPAGHAARHSSCVSAPRRPALVRAAEVREKLAAQGAEAAGGTAEEYAAVIRADTRPGRAWSARPACARTRPRRVSF